jgi:hypothetical protein
VGAMTISWIVLACVFAGALLGITLRHLLPEHHLNEDSKDVVKLGTGLIATMAALVLALLIASAKGSHDMQSTEITEMSADFILLDRTLSRYGEETKDIRSLIPITIANVLNQTWSPEAYRTENLDHALGIGADTFYGKIRKLEPRDDFQRALYAQTLQIGMERKRSLLLEQTGGSVAMPLPGRTGFLARANFRKLRLVRTYKLDDYRSLNRLRALGRGRYFLNPRTGSTVSGVTSDFQRASNQYSKAPWQIALWTSENGELRTCD